MLTAFSIWFAHFMACWATAEIWPHQWPANAAAWGLTALALLALGLHVAGLPARRELGPLRGWQRRFAQGASAIAAVAVVFGALPSLFFLP